MKKSAMILVASLFFFVCVAQMSHEVSQKRLDDAIWLATEIEIPLASNSQVWTEPFFEIYNVIHTNDFRIETQGEPLDSLIRFVVYSNDQVIATGRLFERVTFDEARTALLLELLENNMMLEALAVIYKVRTNGIGDFNVVRTTRNAAEEIIDRLDWIYFIRGAKAISLRGKDGANVNVQPIAKVLDGLLKQPPASE